MVVVGELNMDVEDVISFFLEDRERERERGGTGEKKKEKKRISIVCIAATYVNQVDVVALPQIVQHGSVVQVSKISHILDFLKLWWIHRIALVFLERLFLIVFLIFRFFFAQNILVFFFC